MHSGRMWLMWLNLRMRTDCRKDLLLLQCAYSQLPLDRYRGQRSKHTAATLLGHEDQRITTPSQTQQAGPSRVAAPSAVYAQPFTLPVPNGSEQPRGPVIFTAAAHQSSSSISRTVLPSHVIRQLVSFIMCTLRVSDPLIFLYQVHTHILNLIVTRSILRIDTQHHTTSYCNIMSTTYTE